MAAPTYLTYDAEAGVGGARRPSLADVGGAALVDSQEAAPPQDGRMPYAAQLNQWAKQIAAFGRMVPSARITVDFSAGTPSIAKLTTLSEVLEISDFAVTDNGVGDTTISWTAGALPAVECDPLFGCDRGVLGGVIAISMTRLTATSLRFVTLDDGVAADIRFTFQVH